MATTFRYLNFVYEVIDSQKNEVALIDASHATGTITIPSEVECNGRKFKVTKISGKKVEYWYHPNGDKRRKFEYREEYRGAFQGKEWSMCENYSWFHPIDWANSASIIEVVIPDSVTSIGGHAFNGCEALTSITIPNSVTSIGASAFYGCYKLTSITIPNSVTSIEVYAFSGCSSLTSIVIPNSVTSIGGRAFNGCKALTSITIPNSVTSIGKHAFDGCRALTSNPTQEIEANQLAYVLLMNNYVATVVGYSGSPEAIDIPSKINHDGVIYRVTSIGKSAFYGCSSLTSIVIPNSVTSIGYCAFFGCSSLTSIVIPDSVTSIEYGAFYDCGVLTSITIPNSVTSIGKHAFYGCGALTSITIPNSVTSIEKWAFLYCNKLTSVTIENEEGKVAIGTDAFLSKAKMTYVGKPKGQPAKPIENPYHQAIREAEEAAAKAAEKTTVNVETTPEPSQPVSPTTTQTRNRDKANYVFNGKVYTKKVQLVHDLVLHHLSLHSDLTHEQLKKDFQVQKNMDVMFMSYEMYLSTLAEKGIVYFFESKTEEDTIALQDAKILISSNWPTMVGGKPSVFAKLLDKAKELGYEITVQD